MFQHTHDLVVVEVADALGAGGPTGYACPDCDGNLWEMGAGGDMLRFRCHQRHAMTAEILATSADDTVERALWTVLRTHGEWGETEMASGTARTAH